MKENLKKQFLILLLLAFMASLIILSVFILVIDIFWLLKILVCITTILLSIYIFITIKKLNKQLVYIEKEIICEKDVKPINNKIRCPKCYNLYDGEICFVCGYEKNNNTNQNNG
jgi:predicted membrane protein